MKKQKEFLNQMKEEKLEFHTRYKLEIKCKNERQKEFLNQMKNERNEICSGIGAPGTGKSFLSLTYVLKQLKEGKVDNITIVIPTAPAGGTDLGLGFLKGELEDKTRPCELPTN